MGSTHGSSNSSSVPMIFSSNPCSDTNMRFWGKEGGREGEREGGRERGREGGREGGKNGRRERMRRGERDASQTSERGNGSMVT